MKKILLFVFAAGLFASSCSKKDKTPPNSAAVTFVNGCAGTKIDAKVNGANVQNAQAINFQKASPYVYVTAGNNINVAYYITDLGTPLINRSTNFAVNGHYSVFAGGLVTTPFMLFTTDDFSSPATNSSKVRFVNLSPDSLSFDVAVGSTKVASGVSVADASGFTPVIAGTYEIKAGQPNNISSFISGGQQQFAAGKIYTIILTGTQSGTGVSALKLTLLTNN
ncbi:MAG TPA: DUF4397 domain-containing protein [Flavisolibacter sp.]|nr:DUF4397 domain-containing protein [Flavisolibacter sp.]